MMKNANRTDIQQAVTDSIVARIEQGGVLPWQCPWTKTGEQQWKRDTQLMLG